MKEYTLNEKMLELMILLAFQDGQTNQLLKSDSKEEFKKTFTNVKSYLE